jgi:hypothetical protein
MPIESKDVIEALTRLNKFQDYKEIREGSGEGDVAPLLPIRIWVVKWATDARFASMGASQSNKFFRAIGMLPK